tara:strand:+ start:159 stop:398 length:240 start_codon:yes stop_codon:yes gene_type:complete
MTVTLKRIPMDPEEVERLLATGDYDMPERQIANPTRNAARMKVLEERIEFLAAQQQSILESLLELAAVVNDLLEEASED